MAGLQSACSYDENCRLRLTLRGKSWTGVRLPLSPFPSTTSETLSRCKALELYAYVSEKEYFSCQQHGRSLITERVWIREIVAFTGSNELGSEVITWISISHGLDCIWLPTIAFSPNANYGSVTSACGLPVAAYLGCVYILKAALSVSLVQFPLAMSSGLAWH